MQAWDLRLFCLVFGGSASPTRLGCTNDLHITQAACGELLNHAFLDQLHTFITLFAVLVGRQEAANHAHFYRTQTHTQTLSQPLFSGLSAFGI